MQKKQAVVVLAVLGLSAGGGVWWTARNTASPPRRVYDPAGYGGVKVEAPAPAGSQPRNGSEAPTDDPVAPALEAYNQGDYVAAEAAARRVLEGPADPSAPPAAGSPTDPVRPSTPRRSPERARARWVVAFSAARKKDFRRARQEFARLQNEAADERWTLEKPRELTDAELSVASSAGSETIPAQGERPVSLTGELLPTLEEEGVYQHAVLTGAMGDRTAAEAEFKAFMRRYPESPLVHAAVKRIGRYHGGDIPKDAETVWKQAVETAQERLKSRTRARSMCAPAVLAEVLRRTGREARDATSPSASADVGSVHLDPLVDRLGVEMNTDDQGTTLAALARAAKKRGFKAGAYRLTLRGLMQQLPSSSQKHSRFVIALLEPGHVVLVESAAAGKVRFWDPDGAGAQKPAEKVYSTDEWQSQWKGIVIRLDR